MNIYFICTGNTCRSPMAEALFKSHNKEGMHVRSAGIYAMDGGDISENAKHVIRDLGIDYRHLSRQVSNEDVEWADIILTMTSAHKQLVMQSYPAVANKIFTFKEYVRPYGALDVSDPFGGDVYMYRQTFQELSILTNDLFVKFNDE